MEYFFEGKNNLNYIKLIRDREKVYLDNYYVDGEIYENILNFCELLKMGFEKAKEDGGDIFIQTVSIYEWETCLKMNDIWEKIDEDGDLVIISCDTNDAPKCIINGFIGEIETN